MSDTTDWWQVPAALMPLPGIDTPNYRIRAATMNSQINSCPPRAGKVPSALVGRTANGRTARSLILYGL